MGNYRRKMMIGSLIGWLVTFGTAEVIDREFVTSAKKSRILTNFPK